ncbi:MAG TPA: LamG-like jellyroll fold domain-containing protein, partial [Pilimelia sp.]|nr:LamG-like jellyroll fold domain-containing protein [Pilimelia sp.]
VSPLAQIDTVGGERFAYGLVGAAAVAPTVAAGVATYREILPDTDIELAMGADGIKEVIILKTPSAANSWTFPLRLDGLTARLTDGGAVELVTAAGAVALTIPPGYMEDANVDPHSGAPAMSSGVTYELVTTDGGVALKVTADPTWLADPARTFPVRVDPTTVTAGGSADVYVDNDDTTTNHNGSDLPVGTFNSGTVKARSFVDFEDNEYIGNRVVAAKLKLYHTWSYNCTTFRPFDVRRITSAWTVTGLMNNAPLSAGPTYTDPIGSLTITDPSPACTNTAGDRSVGKWQTVTLGTETFNNWSAGIWPRHGLALTASETDSAGWKRFTAGNFQTGAYKPYLELTYEENIAPQVNDQYPGYGQAAQTLRPELFADAIDPDKFPKSLSYQFKVYSATEKDASGNDKLLWTSATTTARSVVVPAGILSWNGSYYWTAQVSDGLLNNASSLVKQLLLTPVPQPHITSSLSQNPDQGFDATIGNYTTSAQDADIATVGPPLEINRLYNSNDPRTGQAFGAGWSSLLDTKVTERLDATGAVSTVTVTYPHGRELAFGRNSNGTYTSPAGRYAVFTAVTGGYRLVEKDGTAYVFTKALGPGQFGVTSIADLFGRTQTFTYTGTQLTKVTSASGRALHLTWSGTPARIATVASDPVVPGDPNSAKVWTYTYTGDALTSVCPPGGGACTTYAYESGARYQTAVTNAQPRSYWRLSESGGADAVSTVLEQAGRDKGTYAGVTYGHPGPLANSAATAVGFNGTSSSLRLPVGLVTDASYQAVSMWFKAAPGSGDGVLYGQSWHDASGTTTGGAYSPTLYLGSDGKLVGSFPLASLPGTTLGPLLNPAQKQCMEVTGNSSTANTRIKLGGCSGAAHQSWSHTAVKELRVVTGGATRCLAALNGGTNDGTHVVAAVCDSGPSQKWTVNADGSVVGDDSGRCVAADSTAANANLSLKTCQQQDQQIFVPRQRPAPMQSTASLADNNWHHVVLSASGNSQQLYVDGVRVAQHTNVVVTDIKPRYSYVGTGFLGGNWPNQSHSVTTSNLGTRDHFTGHISDVALFDNPVTEQTAKDLYAARTPGQRLTSALRPSGAAEATVAYDGVSGRVASVVDDNGGTWQPLAPAVGGTTAIYESAVLGGAPSDYWRFADNNVTTAVNQVNGGVATYSAVTLGVTPGPFANVPGATVAGFNGTSSHVLLPTSAIVRDEPKSVSLWFKAAAGKTGVLYGYQSGPLSQTGAGNYVPALYVGTDGKLRGQFWDGAVHPITSAGRVDNGQWHHVALAASGNQQVLYLDGAEVGKLNTTLTADASAFAHVGAGKWTGWPGTTGAVGYFTGQIAEVALYDAQLPAATVTAQVRAREGVNALPGITYPVRDPGNGVSSDTYDAVSFHRVAQTDQLGKVVRFGYNERGFLRTVTDPNGNTVVSERDVRGNVIAETTCQDRVARYCSTKYLSYFPDATTLYPPADIRNDRLTAVRDAGSESATDDTYLTTYHYHATTGSLLEITDPLGRKTVMTYTNGTTVPAVGGGLAPAGLPSTLTKPGGAVHTIRYYANGDVAESVDAAGHTVRYSYDGVGRVTGETEVVDGVPGGTALLEFDAQDRLTKRTDPAVTNRVTGAVHTAVTTVTYNADGQPLTETVSDLTGGDAPRTTTYGYDAHGRQTTETDARNKTTTSEWDTSGRVVRQIGPDGKRLRLTYDPAGQHLETILEGYTGDPNNPTPATDLVVESRVYDPAGRLAAEIDAMGWRTEYTYTDNGLVATVTRRDPGPDGTAHTGDDKTFVEEDNWYDDTGELADQVTNNGRTEEQRNVDEAGRVTASWLSGTGVDRFTSHEYSDADDVVGVYEGSENGGAWAEALYDPMGRLLATTAYHNKDGWDPVARWKLADGSGTTAADSAGNSPATASGSVGWSTERGGSATFPGGAGNALASAGPVLDTAKSFTVTAWVKLAATGGGNRVAVSQGGARFPGFSLGYDATANKWRFSTCAPDAATAQCSHVTSDTAAAAGTWVHLAGVYCEHFDEITIYVNGEPSETVSAGAGLTARGPVTIGRQMWNGAAADPWQGGIADVQLYQAEGYEEFLSDIHAGTAPAAGAGVIRTSYTRDADGSVTSVTDPGGDTTYVSNDELGRPAVVTSPATDTVVGEQAPTQTVATNWFGYNTFGEQTESKDPNGDTTVYRYDAVGQLVREELPSYIPPGGTTPINPVLQYAYDAVGQLVSEKDALDNETTYVYDQFGREARTVAPDGGVTKTAYTLNGDVTAQVDPTGAKVLQTYDYLGRTLTSTEVVRQTGANHTTTLSYGSDGSSPWPVSVTSPKGVVTQFTYNAVGEQTGVTDGAGNTTRADYDHAGRPVRVIDPDHHARVMRYDAAGRPTALEEYRYTGAPGTTPPESPAAGEEDAPYALLRTQSRAYDRDSNVVSSTNARGVTTTFAYDAMGRLKTQVEPISGSDSITTTFGYDVAGQRTRVTDGRGNRFVTTYNSWGLPESQIEPSTAAYPALADRTFTATYDAAGRAVRFDSPGGVSATSEYDAMDRLVRSVGTGAEAATVDRTFGYDLAGRVTSATGAAGTTTMGYDDRSLLTSVGGPAGASSYTYDGDGAMTARIDAAGTTNFTYDAAGRLKTVANGSAGINLTYGYNALSMVSSVTHGTNGAVRSFGYDAMRRVTSDELKTAGGVSTAKFTYGWDLNDNLTSKTTVGLAGAGTDTYTYDLADRLVGWDNGTTPVVYAFDKSGNRVQAGSRTFAYDARNQLTGSSDGTTYLYTARGTLRQTHVGSQVSSTVSDAFGQTLSQQAPSGTVKSYSYDAFGRLILPNLTYTGLANDVAGDGTATYVRGPDGGLLATASGGAGKYSWTNLHTDVVGEFGADGVVSGSAAYDPWGKTLARTGMLGKLGYQSQWTDEDTGRVNMWARWYNPDTGAFDSRDDVTLDPTPLSGRANRFAYVVGDPVMNTDVTGHMDDVGRLEGTCAGLNARQCEDKVDRIEEARRKREIAAARAELQWLERQQAAAHREANKPLWQVLAGLGLALVLDLIGYHAVVGCFSKGSLLACADLASNFIPGGALARIAKSVGKLIARGVKAFKAWKRATSAGRATLRWVAGAIHDVRKRLAYYGVKPPNKPKAPPRAQKLPKKWDKPAPKPKPKAKPKPKTKPNVSKKSGPAKAKPSKTAPRTSPAKPSVSKSKPRATTASRGGPKAKPSGKGQQKAQEPAPAGSCG